MSLENTARVMGFRQIGAGVYKGQVHNIHQEIRLLKEIVNQYKVKPFFRQLAVRIINNFPCPHKNYDCYVYAIAKWIRDHIKYVKDVNGYETLQTPDNTLRIRGGDCDDHALLAATLFEAIGLKTYFKIVGENGKYKHIYVVVKTPHGRTWVVDTTEPRFFYPLKYDTKYENEILEELGELGWGFHPFKAIRRAIGHPKIKLKPKKFIKRATGGIRHPKRLIKDIKKKPLAFVNKRFREIVPKPIKATRRAFSPVIKPIEHQAHKIEKLSPVKGIHLAKFLKRITASRSIDEAGIKILGGALALKVAGTAATKAAAASTAAKTATGTVAAKTAAAGILPTVGATAGKVAAGVGTALATNYIANTLLPQQQPQLPEQLPEQMPQSMSQMQLQVQPQGFKLDKNVFNNPLVIAAGILTAGLILRR